MVQNSCQSAQEREREQVHCAKRLIQNDVPSKRWTVHLLTLAFLG